MLLIFKIKVKKILKSVGEANKEGDIKKAIELLGKAIDLEEKSWFMNKYLLSSMYNTRGQLFMTIGSALLSNSDFAKALRLNPKSANAHSNLGLWYMTKDFNTPDYNLAKTHLLKAYSIKPANTIKLNLAVAKILSGDKSGCDDLKYLSTLKVNRADWALS